MTIDLKDSRTLAKLVSAAENREESVLEILEEIYPKLPKNFRVFGITGPPGVGKSTLINSFIKLWRQEKKRVAVLAIDPESPFTRGSVLGDRIRMSEHFNDKDVFIRSLSTRGRLGGLSVATQESIHLLAASGYEKIIVETVGVGQNEVDIKDIAETVLLVLGPEWGDSIQMLKAGILEIADLFVIHKSDKEGAEQVFGEVKSLAEMSKRDIPVLKTSQSDPASIAKLLEAMEKAVRKDVRENSAQILYKSLVKYGALKRLEDQLQPLGKTANPYRAAIDFLKTQS